MVLSQSPGPASLRPIFYEKEKTIPFDRSVSEILGAKANSDFNFKNEKTRKIPIHVSYISEISSKNSIECIQPLLPSRRCPISANYFFPSMCRFRCFDQRAPTVQIWSRLDHPVDIYGVDMIQTPLVLWINELYKSFNWFDWCFWGLQWTILLSRSLIFLSHWALTWLFIENCLYWDINVKYYWSCIFEPDIPVVVWFPVFLSEVT